MQNQMPANLLHFSDVAHEEMQFVHVMETFITIMQKYDFSICFTGKDSQRLQSTNAIAKEIIHRLHGTDRASRRIENLLNYYVALPFEVIKWKDIGRFPEVGNAMNDILSKTVDEVIEAANSGKISRDRALGVINGITSVLHQTGAISLQLTKEINDEMKRKVKKNFLFKTN
ncbi:hypothetical protein ACO0KY_13055 [Undibacterium sp. Dicai25W]|uniref:hypothetical protein n=1 Tax=Undibacterium sp. Dicai25W TaxID=3413034 RepID=UPI003BF23805